MNRFVAREQFGDEYYGYMSGAAQTAAAGGNGSLRRDRGPVQPKHPSPNQQQGQV